MVQINDVLMLNIIATTNQAMKPINDVNKALEDMTKKTTIQRGAVVGLGMAFLFGGMAMNRFFGTALRGIWNTYKEIIDVNDQFFQATQRLNAAWTFFKFSLIDALSQSPLMMNLLEMLIQFINWLGQLGPDTKIAFVEFLIGGWAATKMLSLLGQAILFIGALMFFFGAVTVLTWLGWIIGLTLVLGFFIIFRKYIIAGFKMLGAYATYIAKSIGLAFIDAFIWVADKAVAFINWLIGQLNRIPGINIEWRAERPDFLNKWREYQVSKQQAAFEKAAGYAEEMEEAYSPADMVAGIKDVYNELKDLKASLDKIVENTDGAVVVPSTSQ